ncbi:MAG: putative hydroxymethylpyrimidine transporter CytX [Veillonella sp.]|nr:putative hydroxymethylpyrimidine transporter CytX [Veillonella sp.]
MKTSILDNGLLWFGAAVSIAEIMTGTYFATLGLETGLAAIILGHIIGGLILFGAGYIGAKEEKSAMETVKSAFGHYGGLLFIILNIVQLMGWTSIMIYDGALAANSLFNFGEPLWAIIIGAFIMIWLKIGLRNFTRINCIAMVSLFLLTLVLCGLIFNNYQPLGIMDESLTFLGALELSVAMPLSWLPLISDYTKDAKQPVRATVVSVIVYSLTSAFMYFIGMSAAIYTGETDIAVLMSSAGLGIAGLLIVVFSTVTTTFLDAYSAGMSGESLSKHIKGSALANVTVVLGTIAAVLYPMDNIIEFLYFIGSVFAPMAAVLILDYVFKRSYHELINPTNLIAWFGGFCMYHYFLRTEFMYGATLPAMLGAACLCAVLKISLGAKVDAKI